MDLKRLQRIHHIGYLLKESKFTVSHDFKFNVTGIKIEGKQGEVNNIPQWIGRILAEERLGIIECPDMITGLKQALSKEKMIGDYEISALEQHFYIKLTDIMSALENPYDYDRVEKMLIELFRMRRGKLVKRADSIKMTSELYNKLTVEEAAFYNAIHKNSTDFEKQIRGKR